MRGERGEKGDTGQIGHDGAAGCDKDCPTLQCNQHITVIIWVAGIMVTIMTGLVYGMIDNRNRGIDEVKTVQANLSAAELLAAKQHDEMMARTMKEMNDGFSEIRQRLSRIEALVK
jgi:hypothetical protein